MMLIFESSKTDGEKHSGFKMHDFAVFQVAISGLGRICRVWNGVTIFSSKHHCLLHIEGLDTSVHS